MAEFLNMTQTTKICIELTFDKSISPSQQNKVKEFWKFMAEMKPLEPYRKISGTIMFANGESLQT